MHSVIDEEMDVGLGTNWEKKKEDDLQAESCIKFVESW